MKRLDKPIEQPVVIEFTPAEAKVLRRIMGQINGTGSHAHPYIASAKVVTEDLVETDLVMRLYSLLDPDRA